MTETLNQFQNALRSTVAVLADRKDILVAFKGQEVVVQKDSVTLPRIEDDRDRVRGLSDRAALRLGYHDAASHEAMRPDHQGSRQVFDRLECLRYEVLGSAGMVGIANNLHVSLERYYDDVALELETEERIAEVVYLALRRDWGYPIPKRMVFVVEEWRSWMEERLDTVTWYGLRAALTDQAEYARRVLRLINDLWPQKERETSESDSSESDSSENDSPESDSPENSPSSEQKTSAPEEEETLVAAAAVQENTGGSQDVSRDRQAQRDIRLHNQSESREYAVFTDRFDEVAMADRFCDPSELSKLRASLDRKVQPYQRVITRLANRLQRRLMARQKRSWRFDLEEGLLDCARLSRIVTTPGVPLSYKMDKQTDFPDTVITLLIDNSGSMRGRPIQLAALSADILARTLERCHVKVEILGFTTRSWKGGKAREEWVERGSPPYPGRLNEVCHIIYKEADVSWRRRWKNLGLMLQEGLLKENIDGEALLWAYRRLLGRPEARRVLIVISDGAPIDDATLSTNNGMYLDRHLRHVIKTIESHQRIELLAIGIGHDVARYYRRAVTLLDVDQLGRTMVEKLTELFLQR